MSDEIIRPKQLKARAGISRTTAWHLVKLGQFPKPIKLGARSIGWRSSQIENWLKEREAESAGV